MPRCCPGVATEALHERLTYPPGCHSAEGGDTPTIVILVQAKQQACGRRHTCSAADEKYL
jgi:hypothetical protein